MPVLYLTEQGATLRKEGELLLVTKEGQELQRIPAIKVEQVVVLGNVNLTTPVIHYLLESDIIPVGDPSSRGVAKTLRHPIVT
jgi:CRISPR-associated protein Cas1